MRPLEGLLVLDFAQFLAGPFAATRLADLGARVIKIERPGSGDICRHLYISNLSLDGDSTLFHSINRNKQSYAADLKNPADLAKVKQLIAKADVLIQNFRPGVMDRIGLGADACAALNPRLVYGVVTGYGSKGPWVDLPGQDLLAQSRSGLVHLNGNADQPPLPFGLSVADLTASAHLVQGILAALIRRGVTGKGGLVEVSLLESILDLQFELTTTFLNDGGKAPQRSAVNNGNAYLGAPYGIYATADGYLALAMGSITTLGQLLELPALAGYADAKTWFTHRDEIKQLIALHLKLQPTAHWISRLEASDYWCAEVLSWEKLWQTDAFKVLDWVQDVTRDDGPTLRTTRCPITIDGQHFKSPKGAPRVGQHTTQIQTEFSL
ncbi:CoA transferase [Nibricoccus aquaticus]|uniref:CoA transferase n=1 Tax=Nibricoccus aquaticus TaxID=2576891 RepID=A0A290QHM1_9BACT|nr:CaiB/BaiF CoA-transferase family protein [Nibricoccus aquaticus]ATC63342.1 CoA transferase [Nibricoccus aquaticus]